MTNLWTESTRDTDDRAAQRERALSSATHHLAPTFSALLESTSRDGFDARLSMVDSDIDRVVSSVSYGDPIMFADIKDEVTARVKATFEQTLDWRTAKRVEHAKKAGRDDSSPPQVHEFSSTGEAYDTSQWSDDIKFGDVFLVKPEGVVGVMYLAWPTAVTVEPGNFHHFSNPGEPVEDMSPRTLRGLGIAINVALEHGFDVQPGWVTDLSGNQVMSKRKTAGVDLTKIRLVDGGKGNVASGVMSSGERVEFRLSDSDVQQLKDIMFSDLAVNFSGLTVNADDIIGKASAKDSPGYICTHEGCDYTGTKEDLERHTKDHTSADFGKKEAASDEARAKYERWSGKDTTSFEDWYEMYDSEYGDSQYDPSIWNAAALTLADADEFFADITAGLAFTAVRHEGMYHWAISDEVGDEEQAAGATETLRDALEQARETIDKVLNDGGGQNSTDPGTEVPAPAEGEVPEAPEAAPEAQESVEQPVEAPEDPEADPEAPEAPGEEAPVSPDEDAEAVSPVEDSEEAPTEEVEAPNPNSDMPEGDPGSDAANVVETAEDVSDGSVMEIDPTTMNTGDKVKMTYTLTDGTTGDVDVTFIRADNEIYFFDGPNGEFGIGQRDEGNDTVWVDSEGQHFSFSDGDAMEEVTGEDIPEGGEVDDIDIDAPVEGETKDAPIETAAEGVEPEEAPAEAAPAEESDDSEDDEDDEDDEDFKKKFAAIRDAMAKENIEAYRRDSARIDTLARRAAKLATTMGPIA